MRPHLQGIVNVAYRNRASIAGAAALWVLFWLLADGLAGLFVGVAGPALAAFSASILLQAGGLPWRVALARARVAAAKDQQRADEAVDQFGFEQVFGEALAYSMSSSAPPTWYLRGFTDTQVAVDVVLDGRAADSIDCTALASRLSSRWAPVAAAEVDTNPTNAGHAVVRIARGNRATSSPRGVI